ncbi:S24 family peptidase [Rhizobium sp. 32-5/1]|uniref:S24 family peptidase n=1 Tax=Rhizobium sp. 32-5/1 TaxID=3019602 RepID=UPI00240E80E0|nr:S24 family peptidase [Rhizobium sp. 32-5/1]WEZ84600.1 S24 family peptidase [Rhizobium sp. 32-5/1]
MTVNMHNAHYYVKSKRTSVMCLLHHMEFDDRPDPAKRLEMARIARGFKTAKDAARYFGWAYETYIQHEQGKRGLSRTADRYAKAFRVREGWLTTGEGDGPDGAPTTVPIVGYAGAGPDGSVLYATGDGNFGEVPAPIDASSKTEALVVQGDSMRGLANDGWIIFYDEKEFPKEDHMGEVCVCFLEDDRVLIKTPYAGSQLGLFHLESMNASMMLDVPVRYFAFVTDIKPRRSAKKFALRNPDAPPQDVDGNGRMLS